MNTDLADCSDCPSVKSS